MVDRSIGPVFPIALALTPVLLIGYVEGRRHQETVRYHSGLASSARDRAQLAVAEERIRIARDLHDVVSHGLSVITVQAGSGRLAINESTQEAKDALDAVETTGRQTLGEMRQMLGVLRADEDPPPRDPAPGLAEVHQLIAQLGQAGVEVDLAVSGPAAALTPGVDTAAYRIVQEALTNVARHARTDTCQVRLEYGSESVVVEVIDDGRGSPTRPVVGSVPGQGQTRPAAARRGHLLGVPVPDPGDGRPGPQATPLQGPDRQHPRPRCDQRSCREHQHPHHRPGPPRLRLPQPRGPHRDDRAHPRRPVPTLPGRAT